MLLTMLGALVIAVCGGGIVSLIFRFILRRKTPPGAIAIGAGAAVLTFIAYLDLTWYEVNTARLPAETIIVDTQEFSHAIKPWTLIWPAIDSYTAVDPTDKAQLSTEPEVWATPYYEMRRYIGTREFSLVVNCQSNEIVGLPVVEGVPDTDSDNTRTFAADGDFAPVRQALCS
ncbi:MAG: hypothetical protein AAGG69_08810 [Pseudomonadota bacterium]